MKNVKCQKCFTSLLIQGVSIDSKIENEEVLLYCFCERCQEPRNVVISEAEYNSMFNTKEIPKLTYTLMELNQALIDLEAGYIKLAKMILS